MNSIKQPASIHKKTESTGDAKKLSMEPELLWELEEDDDDDEELLLFEEEVVLASPTVSRLFNKLSKYFV